MGCANRDIGTQLQRAAGRQARACWAEDTPEGVDVRVYVCTYIYIYGTSRPFLKPLFGPRNCT